MNARRLAPALLAFSVPLLLAAVRFRDFLAGGVFSFRDAGFFFVPWRTVTWELVSNGLFPYWNHALSSGRALAADPNAAVFWPLTVPLLAFGTTALALGNVASGLALFFVAARRLGLSRGLASAGTVALLFSGVLQTLALLFTSMAAFAPMALGLVAARAIARGEGRAGRWAAVLAACLALSTFGGEPAVTAIAALGALGILALEAAAPRGRRLAAGLFACALGAALAGVQILPAAGELARSARGQRMRAEEGALFFSVRPTRTLTLLEPRLTGDPFAERDEDFWGADAFDARNPYFYDVAFGLVPLLLALAASADRRARALLLVGGGAIVLSWARFLPGYTGAADYLAIFRYPEKWWTLVTVSFLLAALLALDALRRGEARVGRRLAIVGAAAAAVLGAGALLSAAAPEALRAFLWSAGLGAGPAPAGSVAALLGPRLLVGAATAAVAAGFGEAIVRGRVPFRWAALAGGVLFLVDAAARTASTCPAGSPSLFREPSAAVRSAVAAQGHGRFVDDRSDDREVATRRAVEAGGFDQLRPATGVLFGIRYAGENDIDRMTPLATFEWTRTTAVLPWGPEKVRRYRCAGVSAARTPLSAAPDPRGVVPVARVGGDRIVAIVPTRSELAFVSRVRFAAPGTSLEAGAAADPMSLAVVEDAARRGERACAPGSSRVIAAHANRQLHEVTAGAGGACLVLARSFDPSWRARLDGEPLATFRADGCFTALFVPQGTHRLEIRYANPLFLAGALVSAAALALVLALAFRR